MWFDPSMELNDLGQGFPRRHVLHPIKTGHGIKFLLKGTDQKRILKCVTFPQFFPQMCRNWQPIPPHDYLD